jgi:hypothetical protein
MLQRSNQETQRVDPMRYPEWIRNLGARWQASGILESAPFAALHECAVTRNLFREAGAEQFDSLARRVVDEARAMNAHAFIADFRHELVQKRPALIRSTRFVAAEWLVGEPDDVLRARATRWFDRPLIVRTDLANVAFRLRRTLAAPWIPLEAATPVRMHILADLGGGRFARVDATHYPGDERQSFELGFTGHDGRFSPMHWRGSLNSPDECIELDGGDLHAWVFFSGDSTLRRTR